MSALDVTVMGSGPRVLFIGGSVVGAEVTWHHQHELAEHPGRRGL